MALGRIARSGSGAMGPERVNCVYWLVQNTHATTTLVVELDGARLSLEPRTALSGEPGERLTNIRIVSGGTWEFQGVPLGA